MVDNKGSFIWEYEVKMKTRKPWLRKGPAKLCWKEVSRLSLGVSFAKQRIKLKYVIKKYFTKEQNSMLLEMKIRSKDSWLLK